MTRTLALAVLAAVMVPQAGAQKPPEMTTPSVRYTIPLFVHAGAKTRLILRGKNLDTVKSVTCDVEAVRVKFLAARKAAPPNNYPVERLGDSEAEVELELPKDVKSEVTLKVGDISVPLTVAEGAIAEKEPNDGFAQAQELAVPSAVLGTIGRERDVDTFRITGRAGDRVRIEVEAAKRGSPLDALLTLFDADGQVIDSIDDTANSQDPSLEITLPRDGTYRLSVIDANDLGGPQYGYLLRVQRVK